MSQQRTALARLHEELRNIEVFDRLHDYAPGVHPASERAYANRQVRRKQIQDEITRLRASEAKAGEPAWVVSALVLLCAIGYAMFRFLPNAQSASIHLSRAIVR
jgi:predicted RNA-binding protein associated with RNAse of E/G family